MATILIVDDDKTIRNNLRQLLEGKYQILESSGVAETLEIVGRNPVDLCLLDVNLADGNGFDLCRTIRNQHFMPIIFVTVNDDEDSLTKGLLCGGDDYVTKPFSFVELDLRIMAQLRRVQYQNRQARNLLVRGPYVLNTDDYTLSKDGKQIVITRTEYRLLKKLMVQEGCLVTRDSLLIELWDLYDEFVDSNTLTVNISRIRRKLGPGNPIETVYGVGYRWKDGGA